MKIIFTIAVLLMSASLSFSQGLLSKIQSAASSQNVSLSSLPSLANIGSATTGIMGKLTPALSLTAAEKPKVTDIISGFLKDKASILPLANTDQAAYASKSSGLLTGLLSKLKTVLTAVQFSKLLGLKPAAPSATNVLSSLFF